MTIKVIVDARRANKDGLYPVKLSFSNHGKTALSSLGIYVDPDEFDPANNLLLLSNKATKLENQRSNIRIKNDLTRAQNLLLSLQVEGRDNISPVKFKKMLDKGGDIMTNRSFNAYCREVITRKSGRTKRSYQSTLKKIERYFGKSVFFDEINYKWLDSFDRKMKNEELRDKDGNIIRDGLSTNARSVHLKVIQSVFNSAIDEELIGLELYPFRRYKIVRELTRKRALSLPEIQSIFDYSGSVQENWAVDVAKIIFFLIGINIKDLYYLEEYHSGRIFYKRAKTGRMYDIKTEPEAIRMIEKYKGKNRVFRFSDDFLAHGSFSKKVNKYLRSVGKKMGIPMLTTYVFRHTWATLAAELDIPKETIAAALGHSQNATVTDVYIDFNRKKVDEANRRVIDYALGLSDK
ncbi:site-specific integrase [Parabacteroides sp. Marseille-P3160]|uniref:site-specific integrase n=1 Tax=Parabacteroides sp. Marseille-P3160 TaxID=1917887 RepID=UPI0009B99D78|nr:site-specific integrase [Parabacteroides sp. Marseille-P3160]